MQAHHQVNDPANRGKREMRELARSAFAALERADLTDVLDTLHTRVFVRAPEELIDVELVDGVWSWQFKPMIELMLRHISESASDSGVPLHVRRAAVHDVLD